MGKVLIFSAPSGSGKTTIVRHILQLYPTLEFSISATSRAPRVGERDGVDYYFMSANDFAERVDNGEFIEWEEVYTGTCYGTLRAEISRIWDRGHIAVFDVDVKGGVNLKRLFGDQATSIFIMPPSIESLRDRLIGRATDSTEQIERRVAKAEEEIGYSPRFDKVIVNDTLPEALKETEGIIAQLIEE